MNKLVIQVLKTVANESNKRGIDRIQHLLYRSEKWLNENKQRAENALYASLEKAIDLKLEELTKTLAPGDRYARFELVKHSSQINDALTQNLDEEMKIKLAELQIPFKNIAEAKKIQSWFKKILEKNGFEVTCKRSDGMGYTDMSDALEAYCVYIWWSIPLYLELEDENIDWGHVYDLIQLWSFHANLLDDGIAAKKKEKFHNDKLKEYQKQLEQILGKNDLRQKMSELKGVYAIEFKDWEKKWIKEEFEGKEPKTLKLGSPF